jgi:hypothetical protein
MTNEQDELRERDPACYMYEGGVGNPGTGSGDDRPSYEGLVMSSAEALVLANQHKAFKDVVEM